MRDILDSYFGNRLRFRREELDFDIRVLSELSNVPDTIIASYEAGNIRCGIEDMYKLSRALDVSITYFFQGILSHGNVIDTEHHI